MTLSADTYIASIIYLHIDKFEIRLLKDKTKKWIGVCSNGK